MRIVERRDREPHGLNVDVCSMGILIQRVADRLRRSADVEEIVKYACDPDRSSRPTVAQLSEKLSTISNAAQRAVTLSAAAERVTMPADHGAVAAGEYEDDFE